MVVVAKATTARNMVATRLWLRMVIIVLSFE
jgi:hypothetical protein